MILRHGNIMNPEAIHQIDEQLAVWKAGQSLGKESLQKLLSKQDLLWSYNSNHLEGNTLTYGETELLLIHDQVTGNHSARDIDEMRAHHVAVTMVRQWAQDHRDITETDICAINQVLLKEPFTKETITNEGVPASRLITPGVYKREPNHVRTKSGELFRFAEPIEVPAKMEIFTENLRKPLPDDAFAVAARLANLHHEFILIHPFDDGNGRTIRLLLNYVLLRDGLPAIVIKSDEKEQYLTALRLADAGEYETLVEFLLHCLQYALELGNKAIKGESLDEPDDVDMKLALLKKRMLSGKKESDDVSAEEQWVFCRNYILPYFTQFMLKFEQKDELFAQNDRRMFVVTSSKAFRIETVEEFEKVINRQLSQLDGLREISISDRGKGFLGDARKSFDTIEQTKFQFGASAVVMDERQLPYDSVLSESEAKALVAEKLNELLRDIDRQAK